MPIRLKYARIRQRLALAGQGEALHHEGFLKDPEFGERVERSLELYRSARDEVRRLEGKQVSPCPITSILWVSGRCIKERP